MTKEARPYNGVKTVSLINGAEKIGPVHAEKMKPDHQLLPYPIINSKWIKDLNVSQEIIKILEETIGRKVSDISCSNMFTDTFPRVKETTERINKFETLPK